jgi:hypothetical protein
MGGDAVHDESGTERETAACAYLGICRAFYATFVRSGRALATGIVRSADSRPRPSPSPGTFTLETVGAETPVRLSLDRYPGADAADANECCFVYEWLKSSARLSDGIDNAIRKVRWTLVLIWCEKVVQGQVRESLSR